MYRSTFHTAGGVKLNSNRRASACAGLLVLFGVSAHADLVTQLHPTPVTAPAALSFSNSTATGLLTSVGTVATSPYNFFDSWTFTLSSGADVGGFVGTFNFTNGQNVVQGINNLQLRLTGPGGNPAIVGWQSLGGSSGLQTLFSIVQPTPFAAGNYSVDVRGTLIGPASAYAGTLQVIAPVPVPAALPLLALGLAGLVAAGRHRPKV